MSSGPATDSAPGALTHAVRAAARFDRQLISIRAGLLAAIPVVAVLGGGIATGNPVPGVTMGAGAMLVGIAWRTTGGRPPLALMATDAVLMATSTLVGSVTGSVGWLHLAVLCLWSAMAGLLSGVGNRGGIIGTQAIIAVVVFGRFSEPLPAALGLAGLVLAGGMAQVVFLSLVRWPSPLRGKRQAVAAAYSELSNLAGAVGTSSLSAAAVLDDADAALASPGLFGDPAVMTLRSLVNEGRRLRIQLTAIHALHAQSRADRHPLLERSLALTAGSLDLAARAIEGDSKAAEELAQAATQLSEVATQAERQGAAAGDAIDLAMSRRLSSLAGQIRAVASLAPAAGTGGGLRSRRPRRRTNRPLEILRSYVDQIRAAASLDAPAGRHALRLAVVVPVAEIVSRELPLSRGYWMVVAAATVLRPEFGATFTRGTERALGTGLGVAIAGAIAVGLHPSGGATVVLVGLLAWTAYAIFPASFALGFAFITAVVVFLLNTISPDTLATASARLVDTLVGGAIGLAAYVLWPTWAHGTARQSLAELVAAQRTYIAEVLGAIAVGRRADEQQMRRLARRARLARTNAESAVGRSLTEPETRRIDARQSQSVLGGLRRLISATHVLRLDAQEEGEHPPRTALETLAVGLDRQLELVQLSLAAGSPVPAGPSRRPDLRSEYGAFADTAGDDEESAGLVAELDEMVDAANGLADVVGLGDSEAQSSDTPLPCRPQAEE
jgi:uncharacterized membrane protein YccC